MDPNVSSVFPSVRNFVFQQGFDLLMSIEDTVLIFGFEDEVSLLIHKREDVFE